MRYEVNYPEEPEGPVYEANGTKWVPSEEWQGEWRRDYDTPCNAIPWKEVVAAYGPFTDKPPVPKAWDDVNPGGFYWIEALQQGAEDAIYALAYATASNVLIAMEKARTIRISTMQDDWTLISAEPVVALPDTHVMGLLSRCPGDYRQVVEDRLNHDNQVNWRHLGWPKSNG